MVITRTKVALAGTLLMVAGSATTAVADGARTESARLDSFAEVPTLSTPGSGTFEAHINNRTDRIRYTLRYSRLTGAVQQAHLHLGQRATNGGVSAFLCTNVGGGDAQTPACPGSGVVRGVIRPGDVVGPTEQSIRAGGFNALARAIRSGAVYVNVHTARFPSGEIRGQVH